VLPALDPVVRDGLQQGYGLELIVDDQDFTHESLRQGTVLGCVSTVAEALRGCSVAPLGCMRYVAVASPAFIAQAMPQGLHRGNFAKLPWLVFNRKDDNHAVWVGQAFGVKAPRLIERHVPSTEAHARAALMGWGVAVMPEQMAAPGLADGALQALHAEVHVDVRLHWHQWKLGAGADAEPPAAGAATAADTPLRAGALDRIGRALADGARAALRPAV
jgi:LysR family transcriptional regulator (chromosome initiation inhibitor)